MFCDFAKNEISFSSQKFVEIINGCKHNFGKEFLDLMTKYQNMALNFDSQNLRSYFDNHLFFLSISEKQCVISLFEDFGSMSRDEELNKLASTKSVAEKYLAKASNDIKYSKLYLQLCLILGLFFAVVFI